MTREQMLSVQEKYWRKLVQYVFDRSPYYNRVMKERGLLPSSAIPTDFPILTKKIVLDQFDELVTDPKIKLKSVHEYVQKGDTSTPYLGRYHVLKTSGTSGLPGYFLSKSEELIAGVSPSVARGDDGPWRRKKRLALIGFNSNFTGSSQTMSFSNKIWLAKMFIEYRVISIEQPIEQVLKELNEFQPHIMSGFSKLLLLVADAQRNGKIKITPDAINSGGEQLLETDRRYLKDTFKCSVNNHYGSTEGFSMGISRDGDSSMELFEDHLIFSLNPSDTHITNLHNFTMPLIRYEMQDVLVPRPITEAKPFIRVENLIGRSSEIPYFITEDKNQVTVHPLAFDPLMPEGVKSFFMVCEQSNVVCFHLLIDSQFADKTDDILKNTQNVLNDFFKQKGISNIEIKLNIENTYNIDYQSGKSRFWQIINPTQ